MRGGPTSGGPGQLESPYWEAPNGPVGTVPLAPGGPLRWSSLLSPRPASPVADHPKVGSPWRLEMLPTTEYSVFKNASLYRVWHF